MALEQQGVIVLPGYMNSGEGHWQTRWEARYPAFSRVSMRDWDHPVCTGWCDTLDATIAASDAPVLLAAHSLGCLTVAFWAARHASKDTLAKVKGALLVAVPDPAGPEFPRDAQGFDAVPMEKLPFPSIVVASTDDPYGGVPFSQACAAAWGSRWESIGPRGHINADSGLADWDEGQGWLASMA
ncbi:alpha/beta hydrolase [Burkholderia sp. Ac-20365]|jgi:predicted alpha/beta hydrolase family esterase|uniref:RBBP9/YdeN family alpha/beta hydrolase n=1 Tax=Burkholderia sp. Ac-20365 TaxID=2703897 RepID=UPI00197B6D02|nr:alpha/beta hydrolase [Burkholderia sp. Ac-20365]MBN3765529.1 alpha/beta hydrolase [Burkholderia sp. Ac-20365]